MGRRNWCSVRRDNNTGELSFDLRVERQKGVGETVGCARLFFRDSLGCTKLSDILKPFPGSYLVKAPPPRWNG
jgi:hypothetical protein